MAFSPDGNGARVASASLDKTVRIWDAASGNQLKVLTGHTHYVGSVAFSPDGNGAHPKYIWDAERGECVEHDQPTFKSKWGGFCARCAAAKAGGADCVCGACPKP